MSNTEFGAVLPWFNPRNNSPRQCGYSLLAGGNYWITCPRSQLANDGVGIQPYFCQMSKPYSFPAPLWLTKHTQGPTVMGTKALTIQKTGKCRVHTRAGPERSEQLSKKLKKWLAWVGADWQVVRRVSWLGVSWQMAHRLVNAVETQGALRG